MEEKPYTFFRAILNLLIWAGGLSLFCAFVILYIFITIDSIKYLNEPMKIVSVASFFISAYLLTGLILYYLILRKKNLKYAKRQTVLWIFICFSDGVALTPYDNEMPKFIRVFDQFLLSLRVY